MASGRVHRRVSHRDWVAFSKKYLPASSFHWFDKVLSVCWRWVSVSGILAIVSV